MKKIIAYSLACLASLTLAGTASATLLDFNTGNLGVTGSRAYETVGMTANDIRVDITAYNIVNNGRGRIYSSSQITGSGLGVYVSNHDNLGVLSNLRRRGDGHDSHSLDGGSGHRINDPDEGLLFTFDQSVRLDYINFDSFSHRDDFNLTVDGTLMLVDFGSHSYSSNASRVHGQHDEFNFSNIIGEEFLFWADGNSDRFRIDRMRVSSIPEPASLLLLSIGLIGFFFSRRKLTA